MSSYVAVRALPVTTHRLCRPPLCSTRYCQTQRAFSLRRQIQSHSGRRQSCCAASTQKQSDEKLPYGILPLEAETKRTYEATDRWAAFVGLIAVAIWLYRGKAQLMPWIMQNVQQLDIPGVLAVIASASTAFFYCKNRVVDFWLKQQRRMSYVDIIPTLASDVATLKQDVAEIKDDIKDIKQMLSRPWYKTSNYSQLRHLWILLSNYYF